MNQIANHNSFALPIEQQDFNSHVSLMRSYSLLDIAKYKHKARQARMRKAAYVQPKPFIVPKNIGGVVFIRIDNNGVRHYLRNHKFDHHVKLFHLNSIPRTGSSGWTVEKIQRWCLASQLTNRVVTTPADMYSLNELKSDRRHREIILVRQLAMYLSKEFTLLSFPAIGRLFGDRDHTTILHGYRRMKAQIEAGEVFLNGHLFSAESMDGVQL
jgi:hypothetical protein